MGSTPIAHSMVKDYKRENDMTPEPTLFHIEDGKLVQQQEVRRWRGVKVPALSIPYAAAFKARLKLTDINTNWNGSTYITWITGAGTTVYSNINDYKHIVLNAAVSDDAWYEGTFKFMTRGGNYRSLALTAPLLVDEPAMDKISPKADGYIKLTLYNKHGDTINVLYVQIT